MRGRRADGGTGYYTKLKMLWRSKYFIEILILICLSINSRRQLRDCMSEEASLENSVDFEVARFAQVSRKPDLKSAWNNRNGRFSSPW